MKPVEFQKELNRLCEEYRAIGCKKCPLGKRYCGTYMGLPDFAYVYDLVSCWSDSHPIKTRQSEFLKQHPNAMTIGGVLEILPCNIDRRKKEQGCCLISCNDCKKTYWLSTIPESEDTK